MQCIQLGLERIALPFVTGLWHTENLSKSIKIHQNPSKVDENQ